MSVTTLEEGLGRSGTELIVREICVWRKKIDDATAIASDNPFTKGTGTNSAILRDSSSTASSSFSVAEGEGTTASGSASHAEGFTTHAVGNYSHTEGDNTQANSDCSHAEGYYTIASGNYSHAEGEDTEASGNRSHAGGVGTKAEAEAMTAIGKYNATSTNALFVVGNGTSSKRADALVLGTDNRLVVSSSCHALAFYETSDIRKKNIVEDLSLDRCYDLIDKCQTIIYTLKDDSSNKQQLGLIAQEVNEIFPELVVTDADGMMTLDYSRVTVICLRVLKEVINRLSLLENKVGS